LIAGETGHAHATVWRALQRAGLSRPPRPQREQPRLYEWPCPGDLLHIDSKRFVRFNRPGHAVTGDRHRTGREKRMRIGYEWVHSIVDDHSRYAYSELNREERAETVTAFVERALAHFAELGVEPKRLLSDNAFVYRHNRSLRELLQAQGIEHRFIQPRRPQTNGKVERYQQTLKREWGLGRIYRSSEHRARAVTLARLLQHAQTTQLARRPITHQPCPQPTEVGHLGGYHWYLVAVSDEHWDVVIEINRTARCPQSCSAGWKSG
jgi:transposase InsO family protein